MKVLINGIEVVLDPNSSYKIVTNDKDGLYVYEYDSEEDFYDEDAEPSDTFVLNNK